MTRDSYFRRLNMAKKAKKKGKKKAKKKSSRK